MNHINHKRHLSLNLFTGVASVRKRKKIDKRHKNGSKIKLNIVLAEIIE